MSVARTRHRIAIMGTHGSGKTTLCHEVVATLKQRHLSASLCREAARESHYLSAGSRVPEMQVDVFARQLSAEMEALRTHDIVVCDRTLLDILLYARLFFPDLRSVHHQSMISAMERFVDLYIPTYTLLFRTTQLFRLDLTHDAIRPIDNELQANFHAMLEAELRRKSLQYYDVPFPNGAAYVVDMIVRHCTGQ